MDFITNELGLIDRIYSSEILSSSVGSEEGNRDRQSGTATCLE